MVLCRLFVSEVRACRVMVLGHIQQGAGGGVSPLGARARYGEVSVSQSVDAEAQHVVRLQCFTE